jgi:hypothetical protein
VIISLLEVNVSSVVGMVDEVTAAPTREERISKLEFR